jgi:peroxiredoxin
MKQKVSAARWLVGCQRGIREERFSRPSGTGGIKASPWRRSAPVPTLKRGATFERPSGTTRTGRMHHRRLEGRARWLSVGLLLAAHCRAANEAVSRLVPGSPAPGFALPDLQGKQVRLDDYRGRVVVLNFWAFWCDTWKAEMPHLRELSAQQEDLGFRLVAISVDGTRLPEFRKRAGGQAPFPVLLDAGGQVSARYQVAHVPTVVIVDQGGRMRYTARGYPGNHVILRELRRLASTRPAHTGCSARP